MISLWHGFVLISIIFCIGLIGILTRKNLWFMLLSLEIMLNASAAGFILSGNFWNQNEGIIMYIIIITIAAAESVILLSLAMTLYYRYQSLNIDILNKLKK